MGNNGEQAYDQGHDLQDLNDHQEGAPHHPPADFDPQQFEDLFDEMVYSAGQGGDFPFFEDELGNLYSENTEVRRRCPNTFHPLHRLTAGSFVFLKQRSLFLRPSCQIRRF